jgi:hypothetical protein
MTDPLSNPSFSLGAWVRRYRHFIVLAVVVSLVVWLPHLAGEGQASTKTVGSGLTGSGSALPGSAGAGASYSGSGAAAAGGTANVGTANGSSAGVSSGAAVATGSGPAGGPTASGSTGSGSATGVAKTGNVTFPGVGTAAALANPRCNPKAGRMRIPSIYAAPCVAAWPAGANNGGVTYAGVTASAITIVVIAPYEGNNPTTAAPPTPAEQAQYDQTLENTIKMFTDHYEMWGRHLNIEFYQATGDDEQSQEADAINVVAMHPFLVTDILDIGGTATRTFDTDVAAHGIIVWSADVNYADAHAQPGFRYAEDPDDYMYALQIGEYVGKRLTGRLAQWAGDTVLQHQTRSFGLVYDQTVNEGLLVSTMAKYGAHLTTAVSYDSSQDTTTLTEEAQTQITRLKAAGVTSVVAWTNPAYTADLTNAAEAQDYNPEWIITGWQDQDTAVESATYNQSEWTHAFGIGYVPALVQPDTANQYIGLYQWAWGSVPPGPVNATLIGAFYLFATPFAAGLQLAGPNLSPTTFRNALFNMAPAGGNWCHPSCDTLSGDSFGYHLAFYPGAKYVDVDDFSEKWWNPNQTGSDEIGVSQPGVYEVVNGGERYAPGQWPSTAPDVFDPAHATVYYTSSDLPPQDRPPSYPPPAPDQR